MRPSSKSLVVDDGRVLVHGYDRLGEPLRSAVDLLLAESAIPATLRGSTLVVPQYASGRNMATLLGRCIRPAGRRELALERIRASVRPRLRPERLDPAAIEARAHAFADAVEDRREALVELLLRYETHAVAVDEIARTLDLMRSLHENRAWFQRRVGDVAAFLPANQPLYALSCFGLVPSLAARRALVRPPQVMGDFFEGVLELLEVCRHFPNVVVSRRGRAEFVRDCAGVDAVVFSGSPASAARVRRAFPPSVLVIANGAGHNPIVVGETADPARAVASALRVQLYNQGQDCASPSAILVHRARYLEFLERLREALRSVKVGPYADREVLVGPITRREHLPRIQELLVANAEWLDPATEGVIHTRPALVEPAIVARPLERGGNFVEQLAPVFFVQRYDHDAALASYFEDPRYERHAMYVTVFGDSAYVRGLVGRRFGGRLLHDAESVLVDTDLHAPGVERGTKPYGGHGLGASSVSLGGIITAGPTLPQRDLHEHLVAPGL